MPVNFHEERLSLEFVFRVMQLPAFRGVIKGNEGSSRFAALGDVSRMGSSNQVKARGFSQRMRGEIERDDGRTKGRAGLAL